MRSALHKKGEASSGPLPTMECIISDTKIDKQSALNSVSSRGQFTHGLSDRPNQIMYCIPRGQFAHGLEERPNEKENNLLEQRS